MQQARTGRLGAWAAVLVAVLVLLLSGPGEVRAGAAPTAAPTATERPAIPLKSCRREGGADCDALNGLPHVNRALAPVDLRNMNPVVESGAACGEGAAVSTVCADPALAALGNDPATALQSGSYTSDPKNWANYIDVLVVWVAIGMVLGFGTIIGGCCFCCCRCCCKRCGGGRVDPEHDEPYAPWEVYLTYGVLGLFLLLMFSFMLAGQVNGNTGLTATQKAFVRAPNNLITFAKGVPEPVEVLAAGLIGRTLSNMLVNVVDFADSVVDFDDMHLRIDCLRDILAPISSGNLTRVFRVALDDLETAIDIIPTTSAVDGILEIFTNQTRELEPLVNETIAFLYDINDAIGNITVVDLEAAVGDLNRTLAELKPKLFAVQAIIQSYANVQSNLTASSNDLAVLLDDAYTSTTIDNANASTFALQESINGLPTENSVADALVSVNTTMGDAANDVLALIDALRATQAQLDALPSVSAVNETINEILFVIRNISFDGVDATFLDLDSFFDALPDATVLLGEVDKLLAIKNKIPCVLELTNTLQRVNDEIAEVPGLASMITMIESINSTIESSFSSVDDFRTFLGDMNSTLDTLPNATTFQVIVDEMQTQVSLAEDMVLDLQGQINELGADQAGAGEYNLQPLIKQANETYIQLKNNPARMSASEIQEIRDLNGTREDAASAAADMVAMFQDPNVFPVLLTLSGNLNCAGGAMTTTCYEPASDPVHNEPSHAGEPLSTLTTAPAQWLCEAAGEVVCLYPYSRIWLARKKLITFNTTMNNIPGLTGDAAAGIDDAVTTIDQVDFDSYSNFSQLQDLQSSMQDYIVTVEELRTDLSDIFDLNLDSFTNDFQSIDDLIAQVEGDVASYRGSLDSIDGQLTNQTALISQFVDMEESLYALIDGGLTTLLGRIDNQTLFTEIMQGDGLAGAVDLVLDVAVELLDSLGMPIPGFNASTIEEQRSTIIPIMELVDLARDRDNSLQDAGALYYILTVFSAAQSSGLLSGGGNSSSPSGPSTAFGRQLAQAGGGGGDGGGDGNGGSGSGGGGGGGGASPIALDLSNTLTAEQAAEYPTPMVFGYYENGQVLEYTGGAVCFTDLCIDNTIDVYNGQPFPGLPGQPPEALIGFAPPVSREAAMFLPFLAPFFVIVIGLLVVCFPKCGMCLSVCTLCVMPFFFIFVGALFFPLVIAVADVCAVTEIAGAQAVGNMEPMICALLPNATMTENEGGYCKVAVAFPPVLDWTVELDMNELMLSYLLNCEGLSAANTADGVPVEPVAAVWGSLSDVAAEMVANQLSNINGSLPLPFTIRPAALDALLASEPDLTDDIQTLAAGLGRALGCGPVSQAYLGFKNALCCDMVSALYWWAASFYLMAFTMLCCGCPAGAIAHKRLANSKLSAVAQDRFQQGREYAQQSFRNFRGSFTGDTGPKDAIVVDGRVPEDAALLPAASEAKPLDSEPALLKQDVETGNAGGVSDGASSGGGDKAASA